MKMKTAVLVISIIFLTAPSWAVDQSAREWYEEGLEAEYSQRYERALQAYSEAIKLDPSVPGPHLKRAVLNFRLTPSSAPDARRDLTRAIEIDPDNGEAFYQRARVHFFMLDNEAGRRDMIKAAGLGHEGARAYLEAPSASRLSGYVHLGSYLDPEKAPMAFFEFDKDELGDEAKTLLNAIAHVLRNDLPDVIVYLAGHTDNWGTEEYNMDLSRRRAEAVKNYLVIRGNIDEDRLVARYHGKRRPLASNETDEGRALNRRVELMALRR